MVEPVFPSWSGLDDLLYMMALRLLINLEILWSVLVAECRAQPVAQIS